MLLFLIPYFISDIKYLFSKRKYQHVRDRYTSWAHLAFQGMNPIIFIVAVAYWALFLIDPKLLFGNTDYTKYPAINLNYLHGGNYIIM